MLFHILDTETKTYYMGNYGGLKDIGKIYKTEAGAKQALVGEFISRVVHELPKPVFPGHSAPLEEKRAYWTAAQAYSDEAWAAWKANKHKSFDELFGPRYKFVPL